MGYKSMGTVEGERLSSYIEVIFTHMCKTQFYILTVISKENWGPEYCPLHYFPRRRWAGPIP